MTFRPYGFFPSATSVAQPRLIPPCDQRRAIQELQNQKPRRSGSDSHPTCCWERRASEQGPRWRGGKLGVSEGRLYHWGLPPPPPDRGNIPLQKLEGLQWCFGQPRQNVGHSGQLLHGATVRRREGWGRVKGGGCYCKTTQKSYTHNTGFDRQCGDMYRFVEVFLIRKGK